MRLTPPAAGRRGGGPAAGGGEGAPAGRGAAGAPPQGRGAVPAEADEPAGSNPQVTPIVIGGVMYLPARGNQVLAIDADTGKEVWRHTLPSGVRTTARGVAYWPGDGRLVPRILLTAGPKLVALDAATGTPSADFGDKGIVEIAVPWNGVPTIYKNVAILGATVGEVNLAEPGDTRAFDIRSGKRLWDFRTVPLPGELGHNTWLDNGWRNRSGVNVWAWYMTLDEERGILYMPIAGPAGNYWGGDRPGNNLFANSIVAVDAETGKYPLALPDRASRPLGFGHAESSRARGHHAEPLCPPGQAAVRSPRSPRSARPATCSSSIASPANRSSASRNGPFRKARSLVNGIHRRSRSR